MASRSKYSLQDVEKIRSLHASGVSPTAISARLGIPNTTVRRILSKTYIHRPKISREELLQEMINLVSVYGPEVPHRVYREKLQRGDVYLRFWPSYPEFRWEAYSLCPYAKEYNVRRHITIRDGVLVVGSDLHIWPYWGKSTAIRAMISLLPELKPSAVVLNGDVLDLPQVTRHRPLQFKKLPSVKEELDTAVAILEEIRKASAGAEHYYNYGNHDLRAINRIAEHIPELADTMGTRLQDYFPRWKFQNAIRVNEDVLEIKHRFSMGQYAARHNPLRAGISYCSGHDHRLSVERVSSLRGTIYGIDTGMMAEPWGPQFEYTENNVMQWFSGFAVLTFSDCELLPPELVEVIAPCRVVFRGKVIEV